MSTISSEAARFINELDAAVEAHLDWVRRVLRCAVLRTPPSDDVLDPLAHTLCRFGRWLASSRQDLERFDAAKASRLDVVHRDMHDAIRAICTDLLAGRGGQGNDLDVFEQTQSELVNLLAEFKTMIMTNGAGHDS